MEDSLDDNDAPTGRSPSIGSFNKAAYIAVMRQLPFSQANHHFAGNKAYVTSSR